MFRLSAHILLFALLCCLVLTTVTWFHFSRTSVHAATGFTPQTRLGFPAGDDWEPAIAADHYGDVYVLYKHYDVVGQTSCTSCTLHVLLQISNDRGQTWSAPSPIDPEPVVGPIRAEFVEADRSSYYTVTAKTPDGKEVTPYD